MDTDDISGGVQELALLELLRGRLILPKVVANPGAGAELLVPVDGGEFWELIALRLTFTASAAVANRHPALIVTDPDDKEFLRIDPQIVIAAAGVVDINFVAGLGYVQAANPTLFGLPGEPFRIPPGWKIKTVTALLDVADAYSNIRMVIRAWSEHRVLEQTRWLLERLR